MRSLHELLADFESPELLELHLRTGREPAYVERSGTVSNVPGGPITPGQMRELIGPTPIAAKVREAGPEGISGTVELLGRTYELTLKRRGIELHIGLRKGAVAGAPSAQPTSQPDGAAKRRSRLSLQPSRPAPEREIEVRLQPSRAAPQPELEVHLQPSRAAPQPELEVRVIPSRRPPRQRLASVTMATPEQRSARLRDPTRPSIVLPGPPPPDLIEQLVSARREGASDLHVTPGRPYLVRRAGRLGDTTGEPLSAKRVEDMLLRLLNPAQQEAVAQRGYVDLALDLDAAGRLRANVSRHLGGLKGSFRLVADEPKPLDDLQLPEEIGRVGRYHLGLVIVAGPSGHGKTTTMASLVDLLNSERAVHIITLEDPVEVIHTHTKALISQREVGSHTASFGRGLKAALREDPDVIVIGELRDADTVQMALSAAETGHLVIATMSTPSAAKTIDALIALVPPAEQPQARAMLAGALKMVICQRLLPANNGGGLVPAVEVITGCVPLWRLIREDKLFQLPGLMQRGRGLGMVRFDDALRALVDAGYISEQTAYEHAEDNKGFDAPPDAPDQPADAPDQPRKKKGLGERVGGLFRRKG